MEKSRNKNEQYTAEVSSSPVSRSPCDPFLVDQIGSNKSKGHYPDDNVANNNTVIVDKLAANEESSAKSDANMNVEAKEIFYDGSAKQNDSNISSSQQEMNPASLHSTSTLPLNSQKENKDSKYVEKSITTERSTISNGDEGFIETLSENTNEKMLPSGSHSSFPSFQNELAEFSAAEDAVCLSSDEYSGSGEESDLEDNDVTDMYPTALKWQFRETNPKLPETVTVLEAPSGGKVYLVGTAHFSIDSQEDVAKTIKATQPDIVMVELCKSRVNILSLDETTILEESKNMNLQKIRAAIKQNGVMQGVMYLLLLSMSAHLTKQLGMAPGGEFRRAFNEAKKVPGCLVHLGDRPIHITLQRALSSLSWWQKLRLAWYMLTSKEPISKEEVERCKQKDLLEEMLAEMTGEFPALSKVFVQERDIFMSYSLQMASNPLPSPIAPSGVIPAVVVGVVGIGHVPGIVSNWKRVSEKDIPSILSVPEASLSSKVFGHTFRISILGLAVWGCYRLLLPSSVTSALSPRRPLEMFIQWLGH